MIIPPAPVRILMVLAIALTFLTGWNHPFLVDDPHTMLESIGQVAYRYPDSTSAKAPISNQAFWSEEDSVRSVLNATRAIDNGNMIINQFVTHLCVRIFGTSQTYLFGICSVVGFCLTIGYAWLLAAKLFNPRVALWVAAFCAVNPTLLSLANTKRSYSIAIAFMLIASIRFLELVQFGKDSDSTKSRNQVGLDILAYSLVALLGFFSHFQIVWILLAHVIYAIVFIRDRLIWSRLIISGLILIATASSWLFFNWSESMKNYPELSHYVTLRDKLDVSRIFGNVTPGSMVACVFNNINFLLGYDKALSNARVRVVSILLIIPCSLVYLGSRNVRFLNQNQRHSLFFLGSCAFITPVVSIARTVVSGNLFGMQNIYQSIGLPYFLCILAFFCVPIVDRNKGFNPKTTLPQRGLVWLLLLSMLCGIASYTMRYNAVINYDPYHRIATALKSLKVQNERLIIHVPTLLDAQLLSFFGGPAEPWDFILNDQANLDSIVDQRMKDLGFHAPIIKFLECQKILGIPLDLKNHSLKIDRFDGSKVTISHEKFPL